MRLHETNAIMFIQSKETKKKQKTSKLLTEHHIITETTVTSASIQLTRGTVNK